MSNKEYDANVWNEIKRFYDELLPEGKKREQKTWEVEIKNGGNTGFHKLYDDPKQRLAALFLSSYLSTTWHKITLTEEQRNELLCDNNIKDNAAAEIEKYKDGKDEKKQEGLKKLQVFWESVIKFLGHLELKEYDFSKEQTDNFKNLSNAVNNEDKNKLKTYEKIIYESAVEPYHTILNLQKVINGFGIALACDFLKEAHFCNIAKPDVHICHTFSVIDGISYSMDLALVKRVAEFANNVCQAKEDNFCHSGAYYVDKVIWKICKEDSLKKDLLEKLADLRKNYQEGEMNKIQAEVTASKQYNLECEELSDGITLVKLTKDNVAKVESIIRTDSNYSSFKEANYDNDKYSPYWIKEMGKYLLNPKKGASTHSFEEIVENVIEKIDKENGTHLKATFDDERKTAVHVMKERIIKIKDTLLNYLKDPNYKNGDKTLIDILSGQTKLKNNGTRRHLSFASKFCHYSCYHLFSGEKEQDNYSIYDRYVREALPLYLEKYKITSTTKINDKISYKDYQEAIDKILDKADEKISRNGFDHLVWYYFKGGRLQAEKAAFKKKEK